MALTQLEDVPYPTEEQNEPSSVVGMHRRVSVRTGLPHPIPLPSCFQKTAFLHFCRE